VGQPILAAAGFQPASSTPDEFLGLRCANPEGHEAKENSCSATADLSRFESRLKGGCLGFGLSCGRQSCLQAAFQAAFSIHGEFLGLRWMMHRDTKPEK
jgi:hypothetical protein